jgi:hypothetical protein
VAGIGNILRHNYERICARYLEAGAHRSCGIGESLSRRTRRATGAVAQLDERLCAFRPIGGTGGREIHSLPADIRVERELPKRKLECRFSRPARRRQHFENLRNT